MNKMRFVGMKGWENFLTGDYLGSVTERVAQGRAKWMDSVINENVSGWRIRIALLLPGSRLAHWLIPKIEIINTILVDQYGIRTTIKIGGRVVGSRKWKM